MAKNLKHTADRTTLVDGCGTILKTNRLKGGYRLVKRKAGTKSSATATATAPIKRGRKAKATAPAMVSAPAKRRGRPASVKAPVMAIAPKKRRGGKKASTSAKAMKPSATAPAKRRGRPAPAKAVYKGRL